MKTDRELLVDAARAAGIGLVAWTKFFDEWKFACNPCGEPWNPLIDDGDALRLAVKLRIDVTFNEMDVFAFPPDGSDGCSELINVDDPYAVTRRAIVRAAAEIVVQS